MFSIDNDRSGMARTGANSPVDMRCAGSVHVGYFIQSVSLRRDISPMNSDEESALVLVVERDPHVRELESYFLSEAGFSVDFAEDGEAALRMAEVHRPAIIVTEIMVPKLDGLALCRKVKQTPELSGTIVLIFSILAAHGRAVEAGADAFLMKPLAERQLVQTVRELIARREATLPNLKRGIQR
jgi:two-component system response regulator MprA